jgi:paraquat-inducible protein B
MEQPELRKRRTFSPVWFLPFLALCISGWLLYTSYQDAGIDITVHFQTAEGIIAGKTRVIYKGIPVGTVTDVLINADLDRVLVRVEMEKETRTILVEDTAFWIVKPVISAGKISGLQTLVSGSYIGIRKGKSTISRRDFIGLEEPPPVTSDLDGLHLTLESDALYSLQRRSNVYSKNLKIGMVDDYRLAENGKMLIDIFIRPEYSHLIHEGTRFWNASGLSISGNLQSGLSVDVASMASLLYGGLACATPQALADSPPAKDGTNFHLFRDFEDAQYGIPMTLQLASGEGIVSGKTRVMFKGMKAGVVHSLDMNKDKFHRVTANILLDPRAEKILRTNTKFWVIRPQVSLEGIQHINTLISGSYITFQVGEGEFQNHFVVESTPMPKSFLRPGRHFVLVSDKAGSLAVGAPILYRQQEVGEITDISITEDGKNTETTILIYDQYTSLVRRDAVFWNASGIDFNASLSNVSVDLASLRSFVAGGIAFCNPASNRSASLEPLADNETRFHLYSNRRQAVKHVPAMRPPGTTFALKVENGAPVQEGAPVLFNRIKVGEVLHLGLDPGKKSIEGTILIYENFTRFINRSSRFYNASGVAIDASLQGIFLEMESLESLVRGGIAFFTPEKAPAVKAGHHFILHPNLDSALQADGMAITLHLENATGINKHTTIRHQGMAIGRVSKVWLDPKTDRIRARAVIQKDTGHLFTSGSTLWLVKPQIDLSGIRNVSTAVTGVYIDLQPAKGKPAADFFVRNTPPGIQPGTTGLNLVLESPRLGSLKIGRPIYYRQVPIGKVTGFELGPTAQNVWIHINIFPEYQSVVRRGSRFWHASGINVNGSIFSGVSLTAESMEAIVTGGVAMATPEGKDMGNPANSGDHFIMADKPEESWLDWTPEINLSLAPQTTVPSCKADKTFRDKKNE